MAYTDQQAARLAKQIFERFGRRIAAACGDTVVEESFLAGFIGVEAGKDRAGNIVEDATRFEPHVYAKLRALRDGLRSSYQRIKREQIQDASDAALRNLARSWGITQIMGWHMVNNLKATVADLRDPEKHLHFTVQLLRIVGGQFLVRRDYGSVLRIWNTGSANGKTYHADYVTNALKVKRHYEHIQSTHKEFSSVTDKEIDEAVSAAGTEESTEVTPTETAPEPAPVPQRVLQDPSSSASSRTRPPIDEPGPGAWDVAVATRDAAQSTIETFDRLTGTVQTIRRGRDSVKAAISTWSQVVFQPLWAVLASLGNLSWSKWLTVAAIVAVALLAWHHRQLVMGRIREE
ncbi:MAG TPA: hypothetical protein VMM38_01405 [Aridibacter sp.]|nr:hypothetical protein [Aridibacter sp.]